MPGRDRHNSPICVGTNAVYRRSALVETDGGALVENSEDVHTGFDLLCVGYRTKYVPLILAGGLCPDSLQTFFNQQHRWCTGSMSLLFSRKFWRSKIGLRTRLTFLSGQMYFIYTGLGVLFAPLPAVLMVCLLPEKVLWLNYVLLISATLQSFVFLPLWHRLPFGFNAMRTKLVYSWAHLFAFRDRLVGRPVAWSPSGGSRQSGSKRIRLFKVLLVGWPLLCMVGVIAGSAAHMTSLMDVNYWPPLLFSGTYALTALMILRPLPAADYRPRRALRAETSRGLGQPIGSPAIATAFSVPLQPDASPPRPQ